MKSRTLPVIVDSRWIGPNGIGRFAKEVLRRTPSEWDVRQLVSGPPTASAITPLWLSAKMLSLQRQVFFSPGYLAPAAFRGLTVITVHDLIPIRTVTKSARLKEFYFARVVLPAVRRAFKVLTVSEFSKQQIVDWAGLSPQKVHVVGNGVDSSFEPTGGHAGLPFAYFLYVGNAKPHKNLGKLLSAFAKLGPSRNVKLVIASKSSAELSDLVAQHDLSGRVVITGYVTDEQLAGYYRGAVALVLVSLFEGFGLPVAEAMACGTPVVCSNTTSLPEVAGDAAIFVDPHDTASILAGLEKILDDPAGSAVLAQRGSMRSALFSWDRTASEVWKIVGEAREL